MRALVRSIAVAALLGAAGATAQTRSVCGPAVAGCGPAAIGTGTVTTTTLPAGVSWVSSMLAAWMLDESGNPRVNAQGTTTRNMDRVGACGSTTVMGNSTVDKMEGTASLAVVALSCLVTTDTFSGLVPPYAIGCWVKSAAMDASFVMRDWSNNANTFKLRRTAGGGYAFEQRNTGAVASLATSASSWPTAVWSHVVGTITAGGAMTLYVNGASAATASASPTAAANLPLYLGENVTFAGNLDECFFDDLALTAASVCRICSCGIRGEQCACSGAAYTTTGRNAAACGSCTLPADCSAGPT